MKTAREEILGKLKNIPLSLPEKPDFTYDVFAGGDKEAEEEFKARLEAVNGKVYIFTEESELFENLRLFLEHYNKKSIICREPEIQARLLHYSAKFSEEVKSEKEVEVAVTGCEFLIARTGSVLMSSAREGGRQIFASPQVHVVIAKKEQLVQTPDEAYKGVVKKSGRNLPSQITLITGPSRTADIEKVLTLGAHGPKELHVFLH